MKIGRKGDTVTLTLTVEEAEEIAYAVWLMAIESSKREDEADEMGEEIMRYFAAQSTAKFINTYNDIVIGAGLEP